MTTRTGDPLAGCRALVRYGPNGTEIVRMEDQLQARGPDDETFRLLQSITGSELSDGPFGSHDATVHQFRDVTVVHCPDGDGGTVATFDRDSVDRPLETLIEEVRSK